MMKPSSVLLLMAAALFCWTGAGPHTAVAQESPVVAQDLKKLRAPGKVDAVLWTRRQDYYTLQVVMPQRTALAITPRPAITAEGIVGGPIVEPVSAPRPATPGIKVWLLKADGTHIAPSWHSSETPGPRDTCIRCIGFEVLYRFSLSAAQEAVAVAMRVGDEYYIERLAPTEDAGT